MRGGLTIKGPDSNFPNLSEIERFLFPPPEKAKHDSIIAWGGNLSPGMLLSAYEQGLFPWYCEEDPVIWHSPDPRLVIFPEKLHVSASMKKVLTRREFTITFDRDFPGVIASCAQTERPRQGGTWLTSDMIAAYTELHKLGWAHSAEAYFGNELKGGCYGIRLGNFFFGESMFSRKANASKAAFLNLARHLFDDGVILIDCQTPSSHLESMGGVKISRGEYMAQLREAMALRPPGNSDSADRRGNWGEIFHIF
jgi:leucyl/phenylalanyl-tRNA--protein transferase